MSNKDLEESKEVRLDFDKRGGLLPVIVQDIDSMEILMLGYANKAAFEETVNTGLATFWSTSRNELWTKGKTSGDYLEIKEIRVDCDQDAIVYQVHRKGSGSCHTKNSKGETRTSCFYRKINQENKLDYLEGNE
ncbi:MAG: phosphoribosyl-AMP cyclohydrolase [Thalassobius sp.]|nr:phosphoribosyl-AMP cyclohydrolase [Thalassovita sp.]